jgi:hypothetical protein
LRRDNVKVGVRTALVQIPKKLHRSLCLPNSTVLLLGFLLQHPERGKVVFYFLKCRQDRLPVGSDHIVIAGAGSLRIRTPPSGIEQYLGHRWTDRPEPARPVKPICDIASLKATGRAQCQGRKIRSARNTNLFVRLGHAALVGRDVGTSLQEL